MGTTSRRSFLTGLVSFVAAPAIIKVADLMPIKPERVVVWDTFEKYNRMDTVGTVTGRMVHYGPNPQYLRPGVYAAMIEDGVITPPRSLLRPAILQLDFKVIEERVLSHIKELKK